MKEVLANDVNTGIIVANSEEELEKYVKLASDLIIKKQEELLSLPASTPLFIVKSKVNLYEDQRNEDYHEDDVILLYDEYSVLFTSKEKASKFLCSFMDMSMTARIEIAPISTLGETCYLFPKSILGDGLIMSRIEFKDEDECYCCEDIIADPQNPYVI